MKNLPIIIILFFFSYAGAKELPIDKSVIYGKLDNGFNYTIKHKRHPRKQAELRLLIKIGSLEEGDDQRGTAHFIEHMAFNGSTHFKKMK